MQNTILLKDNHLKTTSARLTVLSFLEKQKSPSDVLAIMRYLQKEKIKADEATIYRILDIFEEKKIIKKIEFGEGKFRYELSSLPHHHHIVCKQCGKVEDIQTCDAEKIERDLQKDTKFIIDAHSLEFFGLCPNCK